MKAFRIAENGYVLCPFPFDCAHRGKILAGVSASRRIVKFLLPKPSLFARIKRLVGFSNF